MKGTGMIVKMRDLTRYRAQTIPILSVVCSQRSNIFVVRTFFATTSVEHWQRRSIFVALSFFATMQSGRDKDGQYRFGPCTCNDK